MKEERTSRCGWEVLTLGRRQQSEHHQASPSVRVGNLFSVLFSETHKKCYLGKDHSQCVVLVESNVRWR